MTLRSTEPGYTIKHNLPAQLTPLIGREQEVAAACALLRRPQVRLLTLTGTGGIGKTRLAIQIATALLYDFIDGVYFVALASINDPGLVMLTIAQTLMNKQQQTKLKPYGFCSLPQKDGLLHRPKWGI